MDPRVLLDFGSFRLLRIGGGLTKVRLSIPRSYRGALEASIKEGSMLIRGFDLASLSAGVELGKLELEEVSAGEMTIRARGI